ncbi:MAG TPA: membrane protein insertase YidC [Acidobacteriaceae bacterium]|nr:membrane protein insertase YidC [Acidobacteriaceae bacterium]
MAEYKNPNQQGGGQDSRSLMVFTFVFAVILLGMQIFRPKKPVTPAQHQPAAEQQSNAAAAHPPSAAPAAATSSAVSSATVPQIAAQSESTTIVENELYKITFSNRGGQATSWILKKYTNFAGQPLDLINPSAAARFGNPLSIYTYDANLRHQLAQVLYVPSASGSLNVPGQLTFKYSAGGLEVRKTFHFDNSYVIHAEVSVTQNGAPVQALLAWPSGFGDQREARDYSTDQKVDRSSNGKSDSTAPKKVVGGQTENGPLDWGGVSDLYFAAIFLPDTPGSSALVSLHHTMDIPKDPEHPQPGQVAPQPILGAAVGATSGTTSVRLFAGPKVLSVLKSIRGMGPDGKPTGADLLPIVHYGMFSLVAKPLFYALRWLHNHVVPNWGWAILLLTVLITGAMLPTRITMMKSSIRMQRIQPQINFIKEKYKKYKFDDPRKADMNREMQELYKKEGVNMFGGCLPMLVQFPLLLAFYEMLENSIELRHAHWFWLHDLSAPDPYHILPILMVGSQFFFQLYTPSPGVDPAQQKMMAFTMPLFSGFVTWHYASGMALYWTASNLINIGQQVGINRTKLGKELRDIQARRAAKKSGKQLSAARR